MKMTILKSNLSYFGGLEKYALRVAHAFSDQGCEVNLLTTGDLPPIDFKTITPVKVGTPGSISLLNLKEFDRNCYRWCNENQSDIIFGFDRNRYQTHYRAGNGVHAAYLQRRKHIDSFFRCLSFSINPLHRYILQTEMQMFNHPALKLLFTNSQMVRDELLSYYQIDEKKIKVVHNGVNWNDMQSDFDHYEEQRRALQNKMGLDPNAFQFLFAGNGYKRKGLPLLLKALNRLKTKHFQLMVVGRDKELKYFSHLAKKYNLNDQVFFHGYRKDLLPFYKAADALIIPSLYDPFASVTLEALSMGLFVISSKYNGAHEILTNESGCLIPDLFDIEAFTYSLENALKFPKNKKQATNIRNTIKHLDFSKQLHEIVDQTLKNY